MPIVTAIYGEQSKQVEVPSGTLLGDAVAITGLPLEQPCAGRGTCGKCKVLLEKGATTLDEIEAQNLTAGEVRLGNRLACRARVMEDLQVTLAPIVVYSNKIFRASNRYRRQSTIPLGVAIDLGTTTVAAMLTMLDNGEVCAGAATLNQQSVYGADVISRMAAAVDAPEHAQRLQRLSVASINQAVDSLNLSERLRQRIQRVTIVGNVAMHHLLLGLPLDSLVELPFQPHDIRPVHHAEQRFSGIFPEHTQVMLPPLVGGFVGSDALACLAYFGFDRADGPMAAIDLGTNGEVMVTDGQRIVTASTAAGPAFEGVNISCGSRAIDGAVVAASWQGDAFHFETIANEPAVGLTGSGLISVVHQLRLHGAVEANGRIVSAPPILTNEITTDPHGVACLRLQAAENGSGLTLTQFDIRELQKAKGAIRAAIETLMIQLDLTPDDLRKVILTGSFGGQIDIEAVIALGMIPPVDPSVVETRANGAGFGAALFLDEAIFRRGEALANQSEQIDLDLDIDFINRYVESLVLAPFSAS